MQRTMAGKNPFDHSKNPGTGTKPKKPVSPRSAMMLSTTGGDNFEVMGHSPAPKSDYTRRIPTPENLPREKVIEPKPVKKSMPLAAKSKKDNRAPPENRRAAALLATSSGFEIMDNNLSKDNYVKRVREDQDLPKPDKDKATRDKLTGENYIEAYRQQQANDAAEAAQRAKEKEKIDKIIEGRKEENKKFFEKKQKEEREQMEAYVVRARQLQAEISLLKRNMGQDEENDKRIEGAIQQLMFELNGIPSVYW